MKIDINCTRKNLRDFNFKNLFIEELGWDHCGNQIDISLAGNTFSLYAVAEKHGMVTFIFSPSTDEQIPDYPIRRKIEQQVAKAVHEHIIIYTDSKKTTQIWQWVKREAGKPTACREHAWHINQPGDSLIQKLHTIAFSLEEEETLNIVEVAGRTKAAFDVERITKRFYDRFKAEHDGFLKFIGGIPDDEFHKWYASVMLNRLMFIYFIQKKGFLDNDDNYLRNKLLQSKTYGNDQFYKRYLCPLFFDGFAKKEKERPSEINKLLGRIPYLNGGLFLRHQIEELHGRHIEIPDRAFEKLFDFFDQYQWHLDERPLRKDNEINPDVLGYIFEKYINQKQMGAYYTKEDITEYISKNTVIPFLFDTARQKCKVAFEVESPVWRMLQSDPDRYIYPAVRKGVELPLPSEIEAGIKDISKRTKWNKPAYQDYALPTEIWREVIARRQRYEEVRGKMLNGEPQSINDLITYNLDIRQFAQDVIWNSEGPELLRAFYQAIENVTVLDPTCGSGAFLFAALNILEPLYEACLDRMQVFLDELDRSGEPHRSDKYSDFRKILKRVSEHPNLKYFIFKSIIINNLYGVDIMEEAVDICKLRLFLKLVAQIDIAERIEPLPDIDFNIRAGNTLVGFASLHEVEQAMEGDWIRLQSLPVIKEKAQDVARLFKLFQQQQTELGGEVTHEDKQELRGRLKILEDELNVYLANEYGVNVTSGHSIKSGKSFSSSKHSELVTESSHAYMPKNDKYEKWLKTHQPFHWFIEFYEILEDGGFDVIIGNPPYVEYSKIRHEYTLLSNQYKTETTSNLYSFIIERSQSLLYPNGSLGIILPLSGFCTYRMSPLIKLVKERSGSKWVSHFGWRPAKLFEGVNIPLTILIANPGPSFVYTTTFVKWYNEYRFAVFPNIQYVNSTDFLRFDHVIPKIGNFIELLILTKVFSKKKRIHDYKTMHGERGATLFYRNTGGLYWRIFTDFKPFFSQNGTPMNSSTESTIEFNNRDFLSMVTGVVNSNLFWCFYVMFASFHHVNPPDILEFPVDFEEMNHSERKQLIHSSERLMEEMQAKSEIRQRIHKGGPLSKIQTFIPSLSKSFNDAIDYIMQGHYDFTDDELDYIVNYDIKYRMSENMEEE